MRFVNLLENKYSQKIYQPADSTVNIMPFLSKNQHVFLWRLCLEVIQWGLQEFILPFCQMLKLLDATQAALKQNSALHSVLLIYQVFCKILKKEKKNTIFINYRQGQQSIKTEKTKISLSFLTPPLKLVHRYLSPQFCQKLCMNSRNRFRGHICRLIWRAHEQCTNNSFGFSPIMWQSTSICFLVSCKTVFDALWVATLFSQCMGIHSFIGYANSPMSCLNTRRLDTSSFYIKLSCLQSVGRTLKPWEKKRQSEESYHSKKRKEETKCINCHCYLYVIKKKLKE